MKRNYFAVLLVTALFVLSSCQFFTGRQASSSNLLMGNWKIDSIATGKDSSAFGYLLLAMSVNESAAYDFQFDKDTLTFYGKDAAPDKRAYHYIDSTHQLVIEDSDMDTYVVKRLNDSTTGLQGKDSSIIFLKKR
jgi:hypothetical protein